MARGTHIISLTHHQMPKLSPVPASERTRGQTPIDHPETSELTVSDALEALGEVGIQSTEELVQLLEGLDASQLSQIVAAMGAVHHACEVAVDYTLHDTDEAIAAANDALDGLKKDKLLPPVIVNVISGKMRTWLNKHAA